MNKSALKAINILKDDIKKIEGTLERWPEGVAIDFLSGPKVFIETALSSTLTDGLRALRAVFGKYELEHYSMNCGQFSATYTFEGFNVVFFFYDVDTACKLLSGGKCTVETQEKLTSEKQVVCGVSNG